MLSKERIIWHLEVPVCRILSGLKIHLVTISMGEMWKLCFALNCKEPGQLVKIMWDMIQKRQRKDSTWLSYLEQQKVG